MEKFFTAIAMSAVVAFMPMSAAAFTIDGILSSSQCHCLKQ